MSRVTIGDLRDLGCPECKQLLGRCEKCQAIYVRAKAILAAERRVIEAAEKEVDRGNAWPPLEDAVRELRAAREAK